MYYSNARSLFDGTYFFFSIFYNLKKPYRYEECFLNVYFLCFPKSEFTTRHICLRLLDSALKEACEQVPGLVACTGALQSPLARVDGCLSTNLIVSMFRINLLNFVLVKFVAFQDTRLLQHTLGMALRFY